MTIKITFPDGKSKEYKKGISSEEIAKEIGIRNVIAAKIDGEPRDLTFPITNDSKLVLLKFDDKEGKEIFWHTTAHILAQAVKKLYPDSRLTIGPNWENGFFYDIDMEPLKPEELEKIEKEMEKIVKEDYKLERIEMDRKEALKQFKDNPYKTELINEWEDHGFRAYKQGDFIDLCRGPHLTRTGLVKALKLVKVSGAYWKGNQKNKQLQRIYGVSFPEKKQLDSYLSLIEEAKKREHVKIGKQLDLFSIHQEGPGFPFFHDKGVTILNELLAYWRKVHKERGYLEVKTPIILSKELWERSGHWGYYRENMYTTKIDERDFVIKPMNCPGGLLLYKEKVHSYRELPLKVGEIGHVHRHELSGVLNGLFRVRAFTQDDAHIFCNEEQLEPEIIKVIQLIKEMFSTFGFTDYKFTLSVRSEEKKDKYIGSDKEWEWAVKAIIGALSHINQEYTIMEGEAKFYGPSLDVQIKDALGRQWQCSTIQLDFNLPKLFEVTYEGADGKKHVPFMLHRVIYGSLERFLGILIEHYAGKFPLWLSPEQVRILTIADRFNDYAEKVAREYSEKGIRATLDTRAESISYKVREAQLGYVNYILVVGEKEVNDSTVTVRTRDNKVIGAVNKDEFLKQLCSEIDERKL